jgi:hypothetical protein
MESRLREKLPVIVGQECFDGETTGVGSDVGQIDDSSPGAWITSGSLLNWNTSHRYAVYVEHDSSHGCIAVARRPLNHDAAAGQATVKCGHDSCLALEARVGLAGDDSDAVYKKPARPIERGLKVEHVLT